MGPRPVVIRYIGPEHPLQVLLQQQEHEAVPRKEHRSAVGGVAGTVWLASLAGAAIKLGATALGAARAKR